MLVPAVDYPKLLAEFTNSQVETFGDAEACHVCLPKLCPLLTYRYGSLEAGIGIKVGLKMQSQSPEIEVTASPDTILVSVGPYRIPSNANLRIQGLQANSTLLEDGFLRWLWDFRGYGFCFGFGQPP